MATPDARINPRKAPIIPIPGNLNVPELKSREMKLGMASVNPELTMASSPTPTRRRPLPFASLNRSLGPAGAVAGMSTVSSRFESASADSSAETAVSPLARTSMLLVYSRSSANSVTGTPPTSTQAWPRKGSTANPLHQVIERRRSLAARATEIDRRRQPS